MKLILGEKLSVLMTNDANSTDYDSVNVAPAPLGCPVPLPMAKNLGKGHV